jgi:hypothetical protein
MQESIAVSTTPPLPGLQAVTQINNALGTVASDFAGDTDPGGVAQPFTKWLDTLNGLLKRRNSANTAWDVIGAQSPIATQAEVNAGTDDAKHVTPLKLRNGFSVNLASTGHIKLPSWLGGWIVQWGQATTSAGGGVVAGYSIAFPNLALGMVCAGITVGVSAVTVNGNATATAVTLFASNPSSVGVGSYSINFLVWGY